LKLLKQTLKLLALGVGGFLGLSVVAFAVGHFSGAAWAQDTGQFLIFQSHKVDDAAYTVATDALQMGGCVATSDTVDSGDAAALKCDTSRNLAVNVAATTGLTYAEDSVHASGDNGIMTLAVRTDTKAALAGTTGDYIPLIVDADGDVYMTDEAAQALLTTIDADTAALVVDLAAIEVLQTSIEGDTTAMQTALEIIDDWDESDRAKVNPIAGQAGVAAGAGAVDALTQRTTLASDDPAVTALQIIDDWDNGSDQAEVVQVHPTFDDDDTSGCVAITAAAVDYTLPDATASYDVCCYGNTAYMLGGTNPQGSLDHTVGNFSFITSDGQCHRDLFFAGAEVAVIGVAAAGFCCFMQKDNP